MTPTRKRVDYRSKNKKGDEVMPTRVLRSHKRKLFETECYEEEEKEIVKKVRNSDIVNDCSDCIIISDESTRKLDEEISKPVTSTPFLNRLKKPKFDESCIKGIEDKTKEIIDLADSSASVFPVVVLSDCEKSDSEIEVVKICRKDTELKNEPVCLSDNVVDTDVIFREKIQVPSISVQRSNFCKRYRKKLTRKKGRENKIPNVTKDMRSECGSLIGGNFYAETPISLPESGLRPIIIDGSNIAFSHSNNRFFSCKGLEICIKYFKKKGHEVTAFVPQFRLQSGKSDNPKLLDQLVKNGDVVLTPSRRIDGNDIVSYDDRFIVQTAAIKGGIIVTRDNYRDLFTENPSWADTIKYRLLQYTWVKDLLMFPNDPLGKGGPCLEEFLKFG